MVGKRLHDTSRLLLQVLTTLSSYYRLLVLSLRLPGFIYSIDLVKTSEESRLNRERREKRRAKIKQDFSVIREMRGTLEFNLATPELSEVIEVRGIMMIT